MTTVDQELGYLEGQPYLEDSPYLAGGMLANMGMQYTLVVENASSPLGAQYQINIVDTLKVLGAQYNGVIANAPGPLGAQAFFPFTQTEALGAQYELVKSSALGMQFNIALYNTTNLRLLCEFPSRGRSSAVGLNAWGNAAGAGLNWKANTTAAGDFDVSNVNTDIEEQYWRSPDGTVSGISLDCDTEVAQGIFTDTLALRGTNLTSSATVQFIGSVNSDFSTIDFLENLTVLTNEEHVYWVSPDLPITSYKYWRISIDDPGNPDGFIKVGAILFGAARIFIGECFVDEIDFELRDFASKVNTEGFTNASNSRAQKKNMRLEFRVLEYGRGNFQLMRDLFQFARTTLKCLYIPTPDADDPEYTARFAVFAKMTKVPSEKHKVISRRTGDYVSFTLEVDESE